MESMKMSALSNKLHLLLLALGLLFGFTQNAHAQCASGSITVKAPLYTVTIDASRLLTYQQLIGTVTKKAVLRADCVGYTIYTVSNTQNLPYSNGTQFLISGKNDFNSPTPKALFLTANNGSINGTVTATGAQTGINSDPFRIYLNSTQVMQVMQPWR
jgi:hypothetical protein